MENTQERVWREDETEIDLTQLLVEVLKNVKIILICALICALALGGWKLAGSRQSAAPTNGGDAAGDELLQSDREQLELSKQQLTVAEAQLERTRKLIESEEEYGRDSVLLNLTPESFHRRDAVWYVDAHYQVSSGLTMQNPNPTGSILSAYRAVMSGSDFSAYVRGRMTDKLDMRYISELISFETAGDSPLLMLTVLGGSEKMADELFEASKRYFAEHQAQIGEAVSDFDVTLVEERKYDADPSAGEGSRAYMERVTDARSDYETAMSDLQTAATNLQATVISLEQSVRELDKSVKDAENTEAAASGGSGMSVGAGAKYAVIGFILGCVLAGVYIVIRFIAEDAALSEEELHRRYGVSVLASVRRFPGKGAWQRMLARLSGDAGRAGSVEEAVNLARANIVSILEADGRQNAKVLLVGKDKEALAEIERLTAKGSAGNITAGGDVMADSGAVEQLRSYENVVLVEHKGKASYREIGRELEKLSLLNKKVIGLIAL